MKQPWQGENNEKLRRLLMDYYAVTGQRIGVFDADFHMLMAYPEPHGALCSWLRSSEKGERRCRECDNHGMREAKRTGRPVVYRCHAGLLEVCVPLQEEGGRPAGYLMYGQLLYDEDLPGQWEDTRCRCADLFPDTDMLRQAFHQVRRMSAAYIEASSHILAACVGYIRLEQLMKGRQDLWEGMQSYIAQHLTAPFTLQDMADALSVSVATLCRTARENSGKTVGALALEGRLTQAKRLLAGTDLPVAEVAAQVGIADYNYFSRLFRRETQISPRRYRAAVREGTLPSPEGEK